MAKSKAPILVGVVVVVVIAAVIVFNVANTKDDKTTVVAMLPLTGNLAFLGEPGKTALEIAASDLNADEEGFSFVTMDTKGNPAETVTAMRAEKDVNNRDVFIVTLSGPSMAAREAFAKDDVAILSVSIHPDLIGENRPVVRFCISAVQEAELLVDAITNSDDKIGLVVSRDAATTAQVEKHILPALQEAGKEVAFVEWFDVGNKDFHNLTAKFLSQQPREILLLGYGSDFPAALGAIAASGTTDSLRIYGGIGFVELTSLPEGFATSDFRIVVPAFSVDPDNSTSKHFREDYERISGKSPSYDAAFTYDAAMVLGELLGRGVTEPKEILDEIRGITYTGVAGVTRIDERGEATTEMKWATFRDGTLELIDSTEQ